MAFPTTHIVLADLIFNKYFSTKNRKKFYIGTSFPDIRYLGVIEREKTHYNGLKLEDIVNEDAFYAGLKFHSFVDEVREKFVNSQSGHFVTNCSKYIATSIKFLEDELLRDKVNNWDEIIGYFDNIEEEELTFGIAQTYLKHWHNILQGALKGSASPKDIENFFSGVGRPKQVADDISADLEKLRQNEVVKDIAGRLYEEFPNLIAL